MNARDRVMDELTDSPGSVNDVAQALAMSPRVVRNTIYALQAEGLVEPYMLIPFWNGSHITYYQMKRTKRSTELGRAR